MKGVINYYDDYILVVDSTKEIPIAQIKKIKLRRHIIDKAGAIGGVAGFVGGFIFGFIYSEGNSGAGFIGGLAGFIPGVVAGLVVGTVVNPFYKQTFKIRGNQENIEKITERFGVGKGKEW